MSRREKYFGDIVKSPKGHTSKPMFTELEIVRMLYSGYDYKPVTKRRLKHEHRRILKDYCEEKGIEWRSIR